VHLCGFKKRVTPQRTQRATEKNLCALCGFKKRVSPLRTQRCTEEKPLCTSVVLKKELHHGEHREPRRKTSLPSVV
jgi:hypothetical protein